jgi:hypothetical protein
MDLEKSGGIWMDLKESRPSAGRAHQGTGTGTPSRAAARRRVDFLRPAPGRGSGRYRPTPAGIGQGRPTPAGASRPFSACPVIPVPRAGIRQVNGCTAAGLHPRADQPGGRLGDLPHTRGAATCARKVHGRASRPVRNCAFCPAANPGDGPGGHQPNGASLRRIPATGVYRPRCGGIFATFRA